MSRLIRTVTHSARRERIAVHLAHDLDLDEYSASANADARLLTLGGKIHLLPAEQAGGALDGVDWRIVVNSRLSPAEQFRALVEELARIYSGHHGPARRTVEPWPDRSRLVAITREVEPEWIAELVCTAAGMGRDPEATLWAYFDMRSREAHWEGDVRLIFNVAARICHQAGLADWDVDRLRSLMGDLAPMAACEEPSSLPQHEDVRELMGQALSTPTPEAIMSFVSFAGRFRRLAPYNMYMVYAQRPGASAVATRAEWASVGQTVARDAIPILILRTFGPIARVYELIDTIPQRERDPREHMFGASGQFDPKRLQALKRGLLDPKRKLHVQVVEEDYGELLAGQITASRYFDEERAVDKTLGELTLGNVSTERVGTPRIAWRIKLNRRMNPAEQYSTLAHELGHLFCGHLGGFEANNPRQDEYGWPDRRGLDPHAQEIEAELVAWLVCERAGLVTGAPLYIKSHMERGGAAGVSAVDIDIVIRALARVERHGGGRPAVKGKRA